MPWKAGKLSVPRLPPTTARAPISPTVNASVAQSTASTSGEAMFSDCKISSSFRRSYRSASAPAGSAKTRFGIVLRNPIRPSVAAEPPSRSTT